MSLLHVTVLLKLCERVVHKQVDSYLIFKDQLATIQSGNNKHQSSTLMTLFYTLREIKRLHLKISLSTKTNLNFSVFISRRFALLFPSWYFISFFFTTKVIWFHYTMMPLAIGFILEIFIALPLVWMNSLFTMSEITIQWSHEWRSLKRCKIITCHFCLFSRDKEKIIISCFLTSYMHQVEFFLLIFLIFGHSFIEL